jgi:transcriptional regulator with PAS, ATPase and Fis domain
MSPSPGIHDDARLILPVVTDQRMRKIFTRLTDIARSDATVLIIGETGTGKEVIARELHRRCAKPGSPFVPINCGAIPDTLAEAEFFGHRRGAFSGADADRQGLLEAAHDGVLFLDEIGDMPKPMQVVLLRFLDSREFRRVGDSAVKHVKVRVVAATNQEIGELIKDGSFRSDLYYRLSVVTIRIPPLRDRPDDIHSLASHSLRDASGRAGKSVQSFSDEALALLLTYKWPGNVRELQNVVHAAVLECDGTIVSGEQLRFVLEEQHRSSSPNAQPCEEFQRLSVALEASGGRRSETAALLGMHRTTLWRKLSRYQ